MDNKISSIIGQKQSVEFFNHLLEYEKRLPNQLGGCYVLSGPTSCGKRSTLNLFLNELAQICHSTFSNFDIPEIEIFQDKVEIGLEQIKEFNNKMTLSSFGGKYRIGIISSAESLSLKAANALLKTLEDARDQVIIFLLTTSPDYLPSTIVSRSQVITFSSVNSDSIYDWLITTHKINRTQARHISRLANGCPGIALTLAQDKKLLEAKVMPVRIFCSTLTIPLYERWQIISKLMGTSKGSEATVKTIEILQSWRLGLRDMLLLHLQRPELIVHTLLEDELQRSVKLLSPQDIKAYNLALDRALCYIRANISPKLVMEQVMMNIH